MLVGGWTNKKRPMRRASPFRLTTTKLTSSISSAMKESRMQRKGLLKLCLVLALFANPLRSNAESPKPEIGQGEWNLVIKTESFTGEGCTELGIDQEIRTGLVINSAEGSSCTQKSPECGYVFDWKVNFQNFINLLKFLLTIKHLFYLYLAITLLHAN